MLFYEKKLDMISKEKMYVVVWNCCWLLLTDDKLIEKECQVHSSLIVTNAIYEHTVHLGLNTWETPYFFGNCSLNLYNLYLEEISYQKIPLDMNKFLSLQKSVINATVKCIISVTVL